MKEADEIIFDGTKEKSGKLFPPWEIRIRILGIYKDLQVARGDVCVCSRKCEKKAF